MSKVTIVLLIIIAVLLIALIVLYFLGKRMQKKQEEQQAQISAMAQSVSMLIIDKKQMKLKDAGLPAAVIELPIVKAKTGPRIMTFICDAAIFDSIPVKKEVKATVSGLYITSVKGLHGSIVPADTGKKKGFRAKLQRKYQELSSQVSKK